MYVCMYVCMYIFMAALGLCSCAQAFSSCSEWMLLFVEVHRLLIVVASLVVELGLQARGLQQLWLAGSRAQAPQLRRTGLVALWHVGSSRTRARTRVPCIGKRILNHCATREAHKYKVLRRSYIFSLVPNSGPKPLVHPVF